MKLTLGNFFSNLIFHPFEADTKIDKAIALAASIACVIFSIGICHGVCALRNYFTYRPPKEVSDQDRRVSESRDSALGTPSSNEPQVPAKTSKASTKIEVTINSTVKKPLDQLFIDSPYSIDNLPVYPIILNKENHGVPKREYMAAPVMKGTCDDGRSFIAIKVDCFLSDEDIENQRIYKRQNYFKTHRKLEDILVFDQSHPIGPIFWEGYGKLMWNYLDGEEDIWDQLIRYKSSRPSFYTWNCIYATELQKDNFNFKLVKTLLKTGKSSDIKGLIWHIAP